MFSLSKLQQDHALDLISQMEEFLSPPVSATLCLQMGFCVSFPVEKEKPYRNETAAFCHADSVCTEVYFRLSKQDALHLLPVSKPKCFAWSPSCVPRAQPARAPPPCVLGQARHGTVQWVEPQSQPTFLTVTRLDEWAS